MKPGNLSERMMVPNPAATKDEDSIQHTSNASMCAFFCGSALKNLCPWNNGSFRTTQHREILEIHKVFLRLPLLDLHGNISLPTRQIFFRTGLVYM